METDESRQTREDIRNSLGELQKENKRLIEALVEAHSYLYALPSLEPNSDLHWPKWDKAIRAVQTALEQAKMNVR